MALVVEDGTGRADADSYISLAAATAYHEARGNRAWGDIADDTSREHALRKATDYMVQAYRTRWAGQRIGTTQALDWPRVYVPIRDAPCAYYGADEVPAIVANACAELALKASAAELTPDLSQAVKRKKVGQVEIEYQDYSSATKTYRAIDNLLAPLLANAGGIRVMRA